MVLEIPLSAAEEARVSEAARRAGLAPAELVKRIAFDSLFAADVNETPFYRTEQSQAASSAIPLDMEMFAKWAEEDARLTPDELADDVRVYAHIEANGIPRTRI